MTGDPHAPTALPPRKNTWYPLNNRLGGNKSQSGSFEKDLSLVCADIRTPNRPVRSLFTVLPELFWITAKSLCMIYRVSQNYVDT